MQPSQRSEHEQAANVITFGLGLIPLNYSSPLGFEAASIPARMSDTVLWSHDKQRDWVTARM